MRDRFASSAIALFAFVICCTRLDAPAQTAPPKTKEFPLWRFDEVGASCRSKGRLQDKDYCESKMMDEIVARGKDAIPILISQLTDTRATKEPIYDFWTETTAGDIAYSILGDLFTDSDWTTFTMPGLESLRDPNDKCEDGAEACWRGFLKKRGRRYVQKRWHAMWEANKDRTFWDDKARCFRVSPKSK
jgi:hypothetical protein